MHGVALRVTLIATLLLPCVALAQPNDLQSPAPTDERSIEHGRRLLANVRDNVLSFDDPAFYWFCRYVNTPAAEQDLALETRSATGTSSASEGAEAASHAANTPTPIKFLLERPGDYRGQPVLIEGTLVAKWSWSVENRDVPALLHQCEIAVAGTRALAAVVTTEPADAIPIRSRVRVKGYFIKIRAFQTTGGESGFGPLLVARSLTPIKSDGAFAVSTDGAGDAQKPQVWILTGTVIAAVIWLMLRRQSRLHGAHRERIKVSPAQSSPAPGQADDFDWMLKEPDVNDATGERRNPPIS